MKKIEETSLPKFILFCILLGIGCLLFGTLMLFPLLASVHYIFTHSLSTTTKIILLLTALVFNFAWAYGVFWAGLSAFILTLKKKKKRKN